MNEFSVDNYIGLPTGVVFSNTNYFMEVLHILLSCDKSDIGPSIVPFPTVNMVYLEWG